MENNKNNLKRKIFKLLGFIVFSAILIHLFTSISYLFRGTQYANIYEDRVTIEGIKEEPSDSIDMIYIGGSAALMYWNPAQAYRDCGFTSYNLAVRKIQAESILAYVKYAQKYQNPDLFVIDVRAFQYYDEIGDEIGLRNSSDAFDFGIDRFNLIRNYLQNRTAAELDPLSLHLDIMKFHTNYAALQSSTAWALTDNSIGDPDKGFHPQKNRPYCYFSGEPQNVKTYERAKLQENAVNELFDLLDYLKANDLNALFVVCPYYITREDNSKYNTISDIVSSYGYRFLNTNDCYAEMEIKFHVDFYNKDHVNIYGAEKYTAYLEKILVQNYDLPDHRGDEKYENWQVNADSVEEKYNNWKQSVRKWFRYVAEASRLAETMKRTENFIIWSTVASDERFTIIAVGNCEIPNTAISPTHKKAMSKIGLSDIYTVTNYKKLKRGAAEVKPIVNTQGKLTADIGSERYTVPCEIKYSGGEYTITIDNMEQARFPKDRVNILVFDNYHRMVVDSVYLSFSEKQVILHRDL